MQQHVLDSASSSVRWNESSVQMFDLSPTKRLTPCAAQVWSLETLGRVKTLTGHTDAVRALAVSNGRLFSGSYDGSVKVCPLLLCRSHLHPSLAASKCRRLCVVDRLIPWCGRFTES